MSSTYLVDTHALLWLMSDPNRLPHAVVATLADPTNTVLVSAASAMEIATKTRLGKLDGQALVTGWASTLGAVGAEELAVSADHGILAGSLAWEHRDPFDRLLVAQAIRTPATLVTRDPAILDYRQVATLQA